MYNGLFYDNYPAIKDVQHKWNQKWRKIFLNESKFISCSYHVKRVKIFDFFRKVKDHREFKDDTIILVLFHFDFKPPNLFGSRISSKTGQKVFKTI